MKGLCDLILEYLYPKYKANYFISNKIFNSIDFSDVKDGLEFIKKEREADAEEEQKEDLDFE